MTKPMGPEQRPHRWSTSAIRGWWRCLDCWAITQKKTGHCKGKPNLLKKIDSSHEVAVCTAGGEPVAVCMQCAGFATKRPLSLADVCLKEVAPNRRSVLRRVAQGLHPSVRPHLRDIKLDTVPTGVNLKKNTKCMSIDAIGSSRKMASSKASTN